MVKVGDRIWLSSAKGPDREGVVTLRTGSMVRVRWTAGQETMVIPAPGTLTVLAPSKKRARKARRKPAAPGRVSAEKTATKKGATKKASHPGEGYEQEPGHGQEEGRHQDRKLHEGRGQTPTTGKRSSRAKARRRRGGRGRLPTLEIMNRQSNQAPDPAIPRGRAVLNGRLGPSSRPAEGPGPAARTAAAGLAESSAAC